MISLKMLALYVKMNEDMNNYTPKDIASWNEYVKQCKWNYRHALKESMIDHEYTYERVDEDGCSSVIRYDFEKDLNTLAEMEEFANDHYRIHYYDRGYDCTGQWFTRWISVFELKDRYVIYVSNSRDVQEEV